MWYHATAAMGGKIYVTGEVGRDGGDDGGGRNSVSYVCVYDPQADAWTQLASISTDWLSHTSAAQQWVASSMSSAGPAPRGILARRRCTALLQSFRLLGTSDELDLRAHQYGGGTAL